MDRRAALAAAVAAVAMASLILTLAAGMFAEPLLDIVSVGSAALALVVMVLAYGELDNGPWVQVGRILAMVGLALVLTGDALQSAIFTGSSASLWPVANAVRDVIGNGLFFVSLLVYGALTWREQKLIAGLAVANGILGYLDLAFAARLGLPPHVNFILLVVWFVALAGAWWHREPRAVGGTHSAAAAS